MPRTSARPPSSPSPTRCALADYREIANVIGQPPPGRHPPRLPSPRRQWRARAPRGPGRGRGRARASSEPSTPRWQRAPRSTGPSSACPRALCSPWCSYLRGESIAQIAAACATQRRYRRILASAAGASCRDPPARGWGQLRWHCSRSRPSAHDPWATQPRWRYAPPCGEQQQAWYGPWPRRRRGRTELARLRTAVAAVACAALLVLISWAAWRVAPSAPAAATDRITRRPGLARAAHTAPDHPAHLWRHRSRPRGRDRADPARLARARAGRRAGGLARATRARFRGLSLGEAPLVRFDTDVSQLATSRFLRHFIVGSALMGPLRANAGALLLVTRRMSAGRALGVRSIERRGHLIAIELVTGLAIPDTAEAVSWARQRGGVLAGPTRARALAGDRTLPRGAPPRIP